MSDQAVAVQPKRGELEYVPISTIRENPVALRTVNRTSEKHLEMVESMKQKGIINPPNARRKTDEDTGEAFLELIDGLHRYTAAKDAGLVEIPLHILEMSDGEVLEAQIITNLHVQKTTPSAYTKQIKRILTMNPMMTESELAKKLGVSVQFIQQRLSLTKIENEDILKLIDNDKITLSNAYALAKLPLEEQAEFLDRAMTQNPDEFIPAVQARVKEIKEARQSGKDAGDAVFQPTPHYQKSKDAKEELATGNIGKTLVKKHGIKSAEEGFAMGVKWLLHMDPESIASQQAKYEAQREAREDAKAKKMAEKALKDEEKAKAKMEEAATAAAEAKAALASREG